MGQRPQHRIFVPTSADFHASDPVWARYRCRTSSRIPLRTSASTQAWRRDGRRDLFFGFRTKADFLYEDELKALEADGTLTKLHVAFSRVGDEVRYLQHLIQKQGAALWPLLSNGGHIFVCGDAARMAPDVRDAVQLVAAKKGGMGESKAQQFLQELLSESALKRYHEDVWAGNA